MVNRIRTQIIQHISQKGTPGYRRQALGDVVHHGTEPGALTTGQDYNFHATAPVWVN